MSVFDQNKRYLVFQTTGAPGRLAFDFMADTLGDAQALAQSLATLTSIPLILKKPDGTREAIDVGTPVDGASAVGGTNYVVAPATIQPV